MPDIERILGGFHHTVARWLKVKQNQTFLDDRWEYPPLEEVIREDRLEEVDTFITRIKNMVTQYILMNPILDLC